MKHFLNEINKKLPLYKISLENINLIIFVIVCKRLIQTNLHQKNINQKSFLHEKCNHLHYLKNSKAFSQSLHIKEIHRKIVLSNKIKLQAKVWIQKFWKSVYKNQYFVVVPMILNHFYDILLVLQEKSLFLMCPFCIPCF